MHISQHKITKNLKKARNRAQSKKQNKSPESDPKYTEIYELPDEEFKIILKKLSILQENTD